MSEQKSQSPQFWFSDFPYFFSPWTISAILLMGLNDHYLKFQFHNFWTGKISDFAGLFYFPVFLITMWRLAQKFILRQESRPTLSPWEVLVSLALTDFLFILFKLSPWLSRGLESFFGRYLFPISITNDPTDLMAIASNLGTFLLLRRFLPQTKFTRAARHPPPSIDRSQ